MKHLPIVSILALLTGCGSVVPGLRFAPSESQKRAAQAAGDLSTALRAHGAPPNSKAAAHLARATRAARVYAGEPAEPVDVQPLIDESAEAWRTLQQQAAALKLKQQLRAETARLAGEELADLAESLQESGKVAAASLIPRVRAIVAVHRMGDRIAASVPVPTASRPSPEQRARLAALDEALSRITQAAAANAARRPTAAEAVEHAEDAALDTVDRIGSILESYGALALLPGGAGILYAARKRKQAKQLATERDTARQEAQTAQAREQAVKDDAQQTVREALQTLGPKG